MSAYEDTRWREEWLGCCECTACPGQERDNSADPACPLSKRFVTVGSVRYGLRLGAVSPPPPGAGPRYRSQCCWPSTLGTAPGCVSRIPLLTPSIYSPDIFRCVNRFGMTDDTTSERETGREVLHTKSILKNQLRRRAFVRQNYSRLFECEGPNAALDRLPRFRFGGNRCTATGKPRDKRNDFRSPQAQFRRQPVPPPRHKHDPKPPSTEDPFQRTIPHRSASFSQVDYSADDNKYVRRRPETEQPANTALTLPRPKTKTTSDSDQDDKKRDKSRRRKGMYISQWSSENSQHITEEDNTTENENNFNVEIPKLQINEPEWNSQQDDSLSPEDNTCGLEWPKETHLLYRADSLSESEHEHGERKVEAVTSATPSDVSDTESRLSVGNDCRRYYKRPLRGPYGQMLEAEMKKPENDRKYQLTDDFKFLEDLTPSATGLTTSSSVGAGDPRPKFVLRTRGASDHSLDETGHQSTKNRQPPPAPIKRKVSADSVVVANNSEKADSEPRLTVCHQRTTSSPSKLEGLASTEVSVELLEQLLRGSSEQLATENNQKNANDTRTHVIEELYETEDSYVDSLKTIINDYLEPLKRPENANLLDPALVEEVFFHIPSLLDYHEAFLDDLKQRLEIWDTRQKIGDVFLELFNKPCIVDKYVSYVASWKKSRDIIKHAQQNKTNFAKFLETMAREHKGKLPLDSLLIQPIQKFPKYELIIQRLLKHTDNLHPDYTFLVAAEKTIHQYLVKMNGNERESTEPDQMREAEGGAEGLAAIANGDRQFLRHDIVAVAFGGGARKERAIFLFSDLLLVASFKRRVRRSTTPSPSNQQNITAILEANKYKIMLKVPLPDFDQPRTRDENYRLLVQDLHKLNNDISVLNQINELSWNLTCSKNSLEEVVREMLLNLNKQFADVQSVVYQTSLELTFSSHGNTETMVLHFSAPDKRVSWEDSFFEARQKLIASPEDENAPDLLVAMPIRKTRAGLQITCAASTMGENGNEVWVCNSDGYVGQVCILSLDPEPNIASCNGVCSAKILCVGAVPEWKVTIVAAETGFVEQTTGDDQEILNSTMWLGTEDGCIHVYNATGNLKLKKNRITLQHQSAVFCIAYFGHKVFVSLESGDVVIYERGPIKGAWNFKSPLCLNIGSQATPIVKILPYNGKLWLSCGNSIKIFSPVSFAVDGSFVVHPDNTKHITTMIISGKTIWLTVTNSAIVKCFNTVTHELLYEINVAPVVTKMLISCDDIIRQHKAACLRVTALVVCNDLLWIGTSAGVLLTVPLDQTTDPPARDGSNPHGVTGMKGVPHGHTGHVRFLTAVEWPGEEAAESPRMLVISGGDGYEDFRSANVSEVAGREDSTNHLLLWSI